MNLTDIDVHQKVAGHMFYSAAQEAASKWIIKSSLIKYKWTKII